MKQYRDLTIRYAMLLLLLVGWSQGLFADTEYIIRYVSPDGDFTNDGTSWDKAKNNLQNALDDVDALIKGKDRIGIIYVQGSEEGIEYVPSRRSTDDADGSAFNTSFRIYAGIYVYGGFKGDEVPDDPEHPELLPQQRIMTNDETYARVESDIDADRIGETVRRWNFKYKSILTGNHSTTPFSFRYDANRGVYQTNFPLNSYHVVWFGTNGTIDVEPEDFSGRDDYPLSEERFNSIYRKVSGHYKALDRLAIVDGFTIEGGYASSTNLIGHDHTGYGGGVYMVNNSMIRNCVVQHCSAMQRGGGVYMDGGGEVERCYIHTCQATGYGMQQGYGGGVCIDYDGSLEHSYVIQCAGRIGAGLAICHVPDEYPEESALAHDPVYAATYAEKEGNKATPYDPHALSTLISNCTSNAEGAGVYLDEGGTLNHCSVVNNKCIGPDIIYYGRRHGRTGGVYVRNGGTIYNSVAWGNECAVNNDVQFAAFKEGEKKISIYHSAFSKSDITDWAAATKDDIISLENANYPSPEHKTGNYPMFKQPTINAGIQHTAGVVDPTANGDGEPYQRVYNWHPLALSSLRGKAVQVTDAVQNAADEIIHAHTDVDVVGRHFESVSSCGALAHSYRNIQFALLPSVEHSEGRAPSETTNIPTLFVDPNLLVAGGTNTETETGFLDSEPMGASWTHPMNNLPDAVYYFKQFLHDGKFRAEDDASLTYYEINGIRYPHVQIVLKEGEMTVAGQGSYVSGNARTASIRPGSCMRLYGGYATSLEDVDLTLRDPRVYDTDLTADVLRGGYEKNSVHVVAIANQHDVIIDGFRLFSGNANVSAAPEPGQSEEVWRMYTSLADGAGVVVNNAMSAADKRRDMTGNILRNTVIANCIAPEGAAVYVSGGYQHGTEDRLCRAELTLVNDIVRNCTAGDLYGDLDRYVAKPDDTPATMQITLAGIITANGNGKIYARNCDVVNNCGFPFKCDSVAVDATYVSGSIEAYNSVIFSNGLRIHQDRSNITNTVFCPKESWYKVTGKYLYMGYDVLLPDDIVATLEANHIHRVLTHNKNEDNTDLYQRVDNGSQQGLWGNDPSLSEEIHEATKVRVHYPVFVNPSRNVGHTNGNDQSYYGGKINYEPLPTNPIVNAACATTSSGLGLLPDGSPHTIAYDFALKPRDFGGDPDVGAIETERLLKGGSVIYVTPDGAGRRDGSSWANAIAGNTVYLLDNVAGPGLAPGDQIDAEPTCDRILDSSGAPVLTTDSKYNGGFGKVWITEKKTGAETSTTIANAYILEQNVYSGGPNDGYTETLRDDKTDGAAPTEMRETTITTAGTTPVGFVVGYNYDDRYPYGEISGGSRSFWRANPYHSGSDWSNAAGYTKDQRDKFMTDCNTNGWINNSRQERYVGGLQYAVEKAAAYNALAPGDPGRIDGIDSVQVWVSNGKYTDYKGFVMRDNTTVMGSFPAKDGATPGLNERQALMSAVIDIPKSLPAEELDAIDYETILQISDTDPKQDNETLNTDAVKYWDDDYSVMESTDTQTTREEERTITHNYIWDDLGDEVSTTYMLYPDMTKGSASVFGDRHKTDKTGAATAGGITWASGEKYVYQYFGTQSGGNNSWELVYANRTNNVDYSSFKFEGDRNVIDADGNVIDVVTRGMELSGGMVKMSAWQTMKNVPAGKYRIQADLAAFYRALNNGHDIGDEETGITFYIIGSDGTTLVSQTIYCANPTTPYQLKRYTFDFTQPANGDLTVRIMSSPGTHAVDPASGNFPALKDNPNRREVLMANVHLFERGDYKYFLDNTTSSSNVTSSTGPVVNTQTSYTLQTHRTTLRKRVLTMPDVCVPTYGAGSVGDPTQTNRGKFEDHLSHTHRVFGATKSKRTSWEDASYVKEDPNYVEYSDVFWDGFTIRHGFISEEAMAHGGGAGVNMYEGAHLLNCVIINNMTYCERVKGTGIFCDGATSTIEGCFVLDNTSTHGALAAEQDQKQIFAGGMFMYEGTCFNSLFAKNYSHGSAGGLGFCVGRFYNNTIAYNTCNLIEGGHYSGGAISLATSSSPNLFVANTIIYGNNGIAIRDRATATGNVNPFLHCYVQSEVRQPNDATNKNVTNWAAGATGNYGVGNIYLNGVAPSAENTPFSADVEVGVYNSANPGAKANNDFRLLPSNVYCINKGTEDFAGTFYTALRHKGRSDAQITSSFIYQNVEYVELPDNDVAFADRVQDCQVDIGAYEYDGTRAIEPHLFPNESPKKAVFFVTQTGAGMATAETPVNAACYLKFQKVLDAAGRWRYASYFHANSDSLDAGAQKYNNFDETMLRQELLDAGVGASLNDAAITAELLNLKDYEVIVRLEGENGSGFSYIPTRSTNTNTELVNELERSLIVPHGIRIEGGYEADFTQPRDILGRPTRFSGEIANETLGTRGNVYHVVTFTNDLFDIKEKRIGEGNQLAYLGDKSRFDDDQTEVENHRTLLDGLFIQDGEASGSSTEHQRGAGAVVTKFAHIRNCVIRDNTAQGPGGGLYLEPQALVSGCIVKNNSAMQGGGLYVEEPAESNSSTFVHIIATTVVDNTATQNAGGMWFQTNVRANSSAFWRNSASDYGNVAGTFATGLTQVVENYPMNYCGVGSRRVAGVNNIELPSVASEGVRWNPTLPYETTGTGEIYFPITESSVLGRAGMTYVAYNNFRAQYPTLELTDIFGLNRMEQEVDEPMTLADASIYTKVKKNNAFIEMGARVMNGSFEVKLEYKHVLTRLFVTTTERLPTDAALTLQNNTVENEILLMGDAWTSLTAGEKAAKRAELEDKVATYKQMGSSFLNPFHRLGDALEYIIKVRKEMVEKYDATYTIGEHFKDVRFEVFLCGGTFRPFRDAHGRQGEARSNTFVVPEEVTIVGGVDHELTGHAYCQETTGTLTVAGLEMNPATTYNIRSERDHMDRNGNHVREPWELTEQTILDGNAVTGDAKTNVYHVITCFPDKEQVGLLPTRYDKDDNTLAEMFVGIAPSNGELLSNLEEETQASKDARTIIIDGVTIMGGHANNIEDEDEADNFQKLTYFRGGGLLVEGNWDNSFDSKNDLPEVLGVAKRDIPVMMTACTFKDNTAGNGGAVYSNGTFHAFSCHFTKNQSEGPMSTNDQKYIPWTAGGAIAVNYEAHLWNSLFANNEAKKGTYNILQNMREEMDGETPVTIVNPILNANARQGYGGAISCSETGLLRICNCDFVRNKAVAFPALYNFIDNNLRAVSSMADPSSTSYFGKGWHFAVNTIFWGNEATASEIATANEIEDKYYQSIYGENDGEAVITDWKEMGTGDEREPNHVANFGPKLDVATLTFCSYEQGTGREGTVWWSNQGRAKASPILPKDYGDGNGVIDGLTRLYQGRFTDVLDEYFGYYPNGSPETPFYKERNDSLVPCAMDDPAILLEGVVPTTEQKNSAVAYNYNLVLESENTTPGGPYFVLPSISSGVDGYMETADWLVARLNNSVDTGWGYLKQNVTTQVDEEGFTTGLYETTLLDKSEDPVTGATDQYEDLFGEGFYNLHSTNIHRRFESLGFPNLLPIGDDYYMEYSRDGEGAPTNMRRISTHPKAGVQDVYIDMGIYEYQYVQLTTSGDEMDVIWVAETQNEGVTPDGSTWEKATSDLQGAIETLLLSRNDHDKVIKLKGGRYSPTHMTQSNHKAFFINVPSKQDGVTLPATLAGDETHIVKSLTIRGGYPTEGVADPLDNFEDKRDPERYPVTFSMTYERGNIDHQLEHLIIIEDAEKKGTFANYMTGKNPDFIDEVMPIVFENISFVNPYGHNHDDGGAAIFYKEQFQTMFDDGTQTYYKESDRLLKEAGPDIPKLIVKNCSFIANGKCENVSAVNIQKGGGEALFVNSLFHSNSGSPINGVNTKMVNCTFALNGGHMNLTDVTESYYDGTSVSTYASGVYNSIIWMEDEAQDDPAEKKMWEGDLEGSKMQYTAYTQWLTDPGEFYEPTGIVGELANHNIRLSTENNNVLFGPNFIDPVGTIPEEGTAEEKALNQKLSRNFRLNPSARILNHASGDLYKTYVPYYAETRTEEEKTKNEITYYFHSIQRADRTTLTDAQLKGTDESDPPYTEYELAYEPRWKGSAIDRGAYESTATIQRVLYVMDGPSGKKDGTTWEHAYDIDQLQRAIDVASVYSLTTEPQERAFVFVRASNYTNEALKLRDGVSVYGGINDIIDEVEKDGDEFPDENIEAYINRRRAARNGVATRNNSHNVVKGLVSDNSSPHTSGFLLDGFWIDGGETDVTPVQMTKDNTILKNDIIMNHSVTTAGLPVVKVGAEGLTQKCLLYNTLIYGSTAGSGASVVETDEQGYVLNTTIVANAPQTALTVRDGTTADHSQNNITVSEEEGVRARMFAPYRRPVDKGGDYDFNSTLPSYMINYQPYWYQLHDRSKEIDADTDDDPSIAKNGGNAIAAYFPTYVNFDLDRDILGNPRRLRGKLDNGCYETWRITGNKYVTNVTNATYTSNYGGNLYPHQGSMVYLDANANMIVNTGAGDEPLFTSSNPLMAGFVIMSPGASIYGQGNTLRFRCLAVEKTFTSQQYSLNAFPYDYDVRNAITTSYDAETDAFTCTNAYSFTAHTYDGLKRSAFNYDFKASGSTCWTDATTINANEGWLLDFGSTQTKTVRFSSWAPIDNEFIYTEDGSDKTVTLTQYNSNSAGMNPYQDYADYPSFTKQEDMGWNLKGQPWLVAAFETDGTNPDFNMDVPHLFYSMNGDGSYAKALGQIYTARSWDDGATIHMGDGFFTQTAIIGDEETLTFKTPVYGGSAPVAPARPLVALASPSKDTSADARPSYHDYIELHPKDGADTGMPYRLGSDGIKWFGFNEEEPQLYVVNGAGTPLSLVSATPIETEIPLGVKVAKQGELTFTLPSPETFEEYDHVWLTDHETGNVTDLTERDYTATTQATGYNETRFTLRIGGKAPERVLPEDNVIIYINRQRLTIKGLTEGDLISIYNVGGILFEKVRAQEKEYHRDLPDGIYIVRVNGTAKKVHAHQ